MNKATHPKSVQDCHDLLAWIIPVLDQFPRARRFTLGERLEEGLLDVLEMLSAAAYAQQKVEYLTKASHRLNRVVHLWRLANELKVISLKRYGYGARQMEDLGQQVGGWLRHMAVR